MKEQKLGSSIAALVQKELADDCYLPIKLADFGMAGFVGEDKKLRGRCGTPG